MTSHLPGASIPAELALVATDGTTVKLSELPGLTILFCYPRTGAPGEEIPEEWNNTPGARGCTAEAINYGKKFTALTELGVNTVFGLSVQSTQYQQEVKERLHLPFDLLSDEKLDFVKALQMPTFEWQGSPLVKRCTLALKDGKVKHVWYPVFPAAENADEVAKWLKAGKWQ